MSDNTPVTNETEKPKESKAEVIARIKSMQAELKRMEATSGPSGAMSNEPTAVVLDASRQQASSPDKRFRWVHVTKAARRQVQGYTRVSEADGGRQVGNLILMTLPREEYDRRLEHQRKINRERLTVHNREVEEVAEGIAKYLRDEKGINVRTEDILLRG